MKFSTKNLLILFGILVIALVGIQLTKQSGRSKSLRSELVSIDTAQATQVVIASTKGEVTLNETDQGWVVSLGEVDKPTKENAVESLLGTLNTIKPGRLAARKKEKWNEYAVDSTGTRVQVFSQDKKLTDIVLGRFGVEGQRSFYTFARLYDDENVYVANDFMKMNIYEEANDYRDNMVLRLKKDSLISVSFDYPDSAFTLVKKDDWYIGGRKMDSVAVAKYFQDLNFVSSKSFYGGSLPNQSVFSVKFSYSNLQEVVVEGYPLDDGMAVKSSENRIEVFNDEAVSKKVFKGPGAFDMTL